ncbi:MAG: DUF2854 domain-containing protein [Thermosynechococcaceae cyanobacterium]
MFRKISLATLGLIIGGILAILGLGGFIVRNPTLNLAGFFYGFPLFLGGLALKITELKPVPYTQPTADEVVALREQQATEIQNQVRLDVTRYRYGIDGHLNEHLGRIGLNPSGEDCPALIGLQEKTTEGAYTLVLEFNSADVPLEAWQAKQEKMTTFFGPGIEVALNQPVAEQIDLALIAKPVAERQETI